MNSRSCSLARSLTIAPRSMAMSGSRFRGGLTLPGAQVAAHDPLTETIVGSVEDGGESFENRWWYGHHCGEQVVFRAKELHHLRRIDIRVGSDEPDRGCGEPVGGEARACSLEHRVSWCFRPPVAAHAGFAAAGSFGVASFLATMSTMLVDSRKKTQRPLSFFESRSRTLEIEAHRTSMKFGPRRSSP